MWRIPYVNLGAQFGEEKAELMPRIEAVLASGMHVGGPEIEALERETAAYVGTRHAVALNSGTDALIFAMVALSLTLATVQERRSPARSPCRSPCGASQLDRSPRGWRSASPCSS